MGFVPFGPVPVATVAGAHLVLGTGDTCEVERRPQTGGREHLLRWAPCPRDLPDAAIEEYRARSLAQAEPLGESFVSRARELLDGTPFPDERAAYGRLMTDTRGAIWAAESVLPGADPVRWTVLHPDGHLLGTVDMPERFRVLDIGEDYVLGRWRDDADVEYVRLYGLVR